MGENPFIIGVIPLELFVTDVVRVKAEKIWHP